MAAGDLTQLDKVKPLLKLSGSDDDAILGQLITQASDHLCSRVGRILVPVTQQNEIRHGHAGTKMITRRWPIVAVTSVTIDGVAIPQSTSYSVNGWVVTGEREITLRGYAFTKGEANVALVYTAGYAAPPDKFERACARLVCHWYKELDRLGQVSKVLGETNVTYSLSTPRDVEDLIATERDVVPV